MDFQSIDPKLASYLKDKGTTFFPQKEQKQSKLHWLLLILFGWLTIATLTQQLLLMAGFLLIVTLIKGPGMFLWGIVYTFLVSIFPPIAFLLSVLFLLLNVQTIVKNWRVTMVGIFFYGYPLAMNALRHLTDWDTRWFFAISLLLGLVILHSLLIKIYARYGNSRLVAWYILCIPFSIVAALLPTKVKQRLKLKKVGR
ncbi:hypothetical protein AX758_01460 [Enterococcus mundtii]|uniref:hypothetical protein n=1 Tax=Enterococcus mundtii TaxID=53346 RepID=UPI0007EED76C|nr:hypothetical protein [Enterococcus mundtii]OBS62407.1 hypothetical protein AX758_01460 [Enterococcus mundtii]